MAVRGHGNKALAKIDAIILFQTCRQPCASPCCGGREGKSGKETMRNIWTGPVIVCVVLTSAIGILHAQMNTGTVLGSVRDPQNSSIPGATVTLVNTGTRDARNTETNS